MYIQLAFRNAWRQRRRMAAITLTMIVGVAVVLTGLAFINGMRQNWLDLIVGTMVGDVGVTRSEPSKEAVFRTADLLKAADHAGVAYATERIEIQGMIAAGDASSPATVRGLDIDSEQRLLRTVRNAAADKLGLDRHGSLAISKRMAADLRVRVGDEVELSGMKLDGGMFRQKASVGYIFEGNVKNAALDLWVLLPLNDARQILGASSDEATSIRFFLNDTSPAAYERVQQSLRRLTDARDLEVKSWRNTDEATWMTSVYVWTGILYFFVGVLSFLIITGAFGIVSAMILERTREVGSMRVLGMTPTGTAIILTAEMLLVGLFASLVGIGISYLILAATRGGVPATTEALAMNFGGKYLYPSLPGRVLWASFFFTTLLAVVSGIVPILRVSLVKEIDALRHV